jgi:hypothetical protein
MLIDRQRIAIARSASGIEREDSRFLRGEGELKPGHFDILAGGAETDPGRADAVGIGRTDLEPSP